MSQSYPSIPPDAMAGELIGFTFVDVCASPDSTVFHIQSIAVPAVWSFLQQIRKASVFGKCRAQRITSAQSGQEARHRYNITKSGQFLELNTRC